MKSRILNALFTLSAVVWLTAVFYGQTARSPMFEVTVPFEFVAGGMTLPAGQYTVSHMMNSNWVRLSRSDGHAIATVQVLESAAPRGKSDTKLVFNRNADTYFLSQVWTARDQQVHDCIKSNAERIYPAVAESQFR